MRVGIEAVNFYGGRTFLNINGLFEARNLDRRRFDNLMIRRKSVALPCEDPVSFGVNAAKPLLDRLSSAEKNRIELLIAATESGLDFGKSLSTYFHAYLGLSRSCRLFEVKNACYAGTAAFQIAVNFVAANSSPGAKALVIATDIAKAAVKRSYVEPSQGAGAVALLVSNNPEVFEVDFGANGFHSYEVMDSCRPTPEIEAGDTDLSLLAYLDCLENSFREYVNRVEGADFQTTFDYLAFHTPFPGMVKGAHRMMMRKLKGLPGTASDADFERRVTPSLLYCSEVGNIYSATLYLALCGLIDSVNLQTPKRIGLYSYGSGCSSEFFSGILFPNAKAKLAALRIGEALQDRYELNMQEYDDLLDLAVEWVFGTKDKDVDNRAYQAIYDRSIAGKGILVLKSIKNYHREYQWS
jgi:polyketide biosynthesis 3-hydroxy-3-methylglutaryl-CoA synthase-like enzyme PksG